MPESTAKKSAQSDGNVKETIESILIAFILAFIFRAFVVEAFVIPTGSMAPTLYGAHTRYTCPDCGFVFDAGVQGKKTADNDIDIPSDARPAINYHCPNCGYEFSASEFRPVRFGDRILVLKYLYLFQKPVPGDVVVFKSPDEPDYVPEDPEYGMNYIKRLIGVGPESVVILDGDVYTGPFEANRPTGPDGKPWFKIQRKPGYAQDALWRVIYNNDFVPHLGDSEHSWSQPWQQESGSAGWTLSGVPNTKWAAGVPSRIFDFSNAQGSGAIVFNPDPNSPNHPLTDFLVYDEWEHVTQSWQPLYVSDLKLSCFYTRRTGDGPLRLQLSKNTDLFTAEVTPGKVRLLRGKRVQPDLATAVNEQLVGEAVSIGALEGKEPVQVELTNVDYRVSVRINGVEVLSTQDDYAPNVEELWRQEEDLTSQRSQMSRPFARPIVRIEAQKQDARLEHVVLSRDIYYLSQRGPTFWATVDKVSHLNAGEYFVMGDNSFISGDARYWKQPINLPHEGLQVESGRVPERFMLGKAFFVYWPAGYRMPFIPVNAVPDFGEMRFIRLNDRANWLSKSARPEPAFRSQIER